MQLQAIKTGGVGGLGMRLGTLGLGLKARPSRI